MTRRFEVGPALVILGGIVLLVSLFLPWYGDADAWLVFEVVDVLLAGLGLAVIACAAGQLIPELEFMDRRWLPGLLLAIVALVAAEILSPPIVTADEDATTGAWIALAAALVALIGTVLSLGRVSLSVAVEGREPQRVAAVDHRQETTDTPAVVVPDDDAGTPPAQSAAGGRKR